MPSCRDGSAILLWTIWLVSVGKLRPKLKGASGLVGAEVLPSRCKDAIIQRFFS